MFTQRKRKLLKKIRKKRYTRSAPQFNSVEWEQEQELWDLHEEDNNGEKLDPAKIEEIIMYCVIKQNLPTRYLSSKEKRDPKNWFPTPQIYNKELLKEMGIKKPL